MIGLVIMGFVLVDLSLRGKVVSVLCVSCGSCGARVVRRSVLSECPGARRRLAFKDVLLGLLPGSKRTARTGFCVPHQEPSSRLQYHCGVAF